MKKIASTHIQSSLSNISLGDDEVKHGSLGSCGSE
jgi:hypothetical protein